MFLSYSKPIYHSDYQVPNLFNIKNGTPDDVSTSHYIYNAIQLYISLSLSSVEMALLAYVHAN
jgi:hypothetical protein